MRRSFIVGAVALPLLSAGTAQAAEEPVHLGPRPFYLVDKMDEGQLKDRLLACDAGSMKRTDWSIGHRGAALQFPEHTEESYRAAARMGAGIVECDVTFTRDRQLVCRHAQDDLHTTTNILATDLASTCVESFTPASGEDRASAKCTTADITLDEFKSLEAKMDAAGISCRSNGAIVPSERAPRGWRSSHGPRAVGTSVRRHQTVGDLIDDEGDIYSVLDVLRRDIGVAGVFSDWPATTTFFANCVE
jgi:glycerophosphoryl diester phosphodiesterase